MRNVTQQCVGLRAVAALILIVVLGLAATTQVHAQSLKTLYNFGGGPDGGDPYASLIRDSAGNLYSTVDYGGTSYAGAVFKVDPKGNESVLHSFSGGADGAYPFSALVRDSSGNLYGTTSQGGSANAGVVFKVDPSGKETVLHNFTGGADGVIPIGGLLRDTAGNFYGTTSQGGTANFGVIFKVSPKGKETIVHTFTGGAKDGKYPSYTSLLPGADGYFYGVTQEGGIADYGVVYKLSPSGKLTVLHSFAGGTADGCDVLGTPFMDANGTLYGTTSSCGPGGYGTVWKVNKYRKETVLHGFAGGTADGQYPLAGVIVDANGNIYGNTETGGESNLGTVYKISKAGKFSLLHSFAGPDGKYPYGSFVMNSNGALFGTTQNGGSIGYGTVWKIVK